MIDFHDLSILTGILERGIIFGIAVLSVYLSSRVMVFDDLSIEGSFGLGGAIGAASLIWGVPWYFSLMLACICGMISGSITGFIHTRLGINNLLSGIIVSGMLFSINLKIAGTNLPIPIGKTVFDIIATLFNRQATVFFLIPFACALGLIFDWFLRTQIGLVMRATGSNLLTTTAIGKSPTFYLTTALSFSNGMSALSGALFTQYVGYFSIWSGFGILITSLIGLLITESLTQARGVPLILGAVIYQAVISLIFELSIDQNWHRFITALSMIILMTFQQFHKKENKE